MGAGSPFSYVSPQIEQLLGFPAERWVAEPDLWAERLHPADRELVLMEEMRTFQHEIEYDREYRLIAADGSVGGCGSATRSCATTTAARSRPRA